jgi:subtilisin family serine protease
MSKVQEGKIKDYSYQTDYYLLDPPESKSPDRYIAELKFTGAFEWVVEDVIADPVAFCTNDPLLNSQYHHDIMESCEAWEIHPGSPSIHVAICDTGIDIGHEDLEPNRLPAYNAVLSTRGAEGGTAENGKPTLVYAGDPSSHGVCVAGCAGAMAFLVLQKT